MSRASDREIDGSSGERALQEKELFRRKSPPERILLIDAKDGWITVSGLQSVMLL